MSDNLFSLIRTNRLTVLFFFFFNDTATTEIYTLSLHDALPISAWSRAEPVRPGFMAVGHQLPRSEEHTSELQSHLKLVCRLLLEKKKKHKQQNKHPFSPLHLDSNDQTTAPS